MSSETASTRRSFLKTGALFAVPIAAPAAAAIGQDDLHARLARHEDEAAIRALHKAWLRDVDRGYLPQVADAGLRRISADPDHPTDHVRIAADGTRAQGRFACTVEIEATPPADGTFAHMARLQGNGSARRVERRLVTADYAKTSSGWSVTNIRLSLHPAA